MNDVDQVAAECEFQACELAREYYGAELFEAARAGEHVQRFLRVVASGLARSFVAGVDHGAARAGRVPR